VTWIGKAGNQSRRRHPPGASSGITPIQSGDRLEVRIQGLAPLVNSVK
jgi:hypothetical protein